MLTFDMRNSVTASKNIERNREELVVNPARIKREYSHQEEKVSNRIHIRQHLFGRLAFVQPNSKAKEDSTMANITKHHSKKEWENGNGIECWIDFLVPRHTICVNNFLESGCELVDLEMSGRFCIWFFFSDAHKGRNQRVHQANFVSRDPDPSTHNLPIFLHQIKGIVYNGLPL